MSKENCLMGITVFDLKDTELMTKIYNSLREDERFTFYKDYIIDLNKLVLFNIETKEYINGEDVEEWDFEDVLNNHEKYLLFNIDWLDKTSEYEMDNIGCDIFVNQSKMLTVVKDYVFRPTSFFEGRANLFYEVKSVRTEYIVLCFEYRSNYGEYAGEYDYDYTFKGIVDMSKIEVIK